MISTVLVLHIRLGFFGFSIRVVSASGWDSSGSIKVSSRVLIPGSWKDRPRSPDANTPRTASQFLFHIEQLPGKLLAIYLLNQSKSLN